ncbi:MAG: hypothetical protein ACXVLQ_12010 [Bacteriovorax sp.]
MKSILIAALLVMNSALLASESCHDLMRPFLRHDEGKSIGSKTANMDITKYGLAENAVDREKFERLYAQCLSSEKNEVKDLAHKRFSTVSKTISNATTLIGYMNNNWEKPKDMEWFERLGFGLVFGAVAGKLHHKLVTDNGNRFSYVIKDFLFSRGATVAYFGGSMLLFDNDRAQKKKLEELKKSPTFDEDLKKLKAYVDSDSLIERYQKELTAYLSYQDEMNTGLGVHDGVDFDHLKPSDLNDPDIQKVVIAAIVAQEYESLNGPLVITGSKNKDFFLYDSIYFFLKIPKDIVVNKMIDQAMCLNSNNLSRGYTQAVGISVINQILFADYYGITYKVLKKELIDQ